MSQLVPLGDFLDNKWFSSEVVDKGKKHPVSNFFKLCVSVLGMACVGLIAPFMGLSIIAQISVIGFDTWNEIPDEMPDVVIAEHNYLYDKNGSVFADLWEQNRVELSSLNDISQYAKQGLIDTEDKKFYSHNGFNLSGAFRAALSGHGGGSGITQQLVKNLQFFNYAGTEDEKNQAIEKSYQRKLKELKTAMKYEKDHSKDEILLNYFNTVSFGGPSVYGIETASQYFFGKHAKNLSIAESAALVGSVQNPVRYNLAKESEKEYWKERQEKVIDRLLAEGHITKKQAKEAKAEKLHIVLKKSSGGNCSSSKFPEYCTYVMNYIKESPRYGETREEREALLAKGGLHIHTYLDPHAMKISNKVLKDGFGTRNRIVAPTAVVQPGTGGVLSIAQNRNYGVGKGKTTLITPLIPTGEGSVYKIFTLAAALNEGMTEGDLAFSSECPLRPGKRYDAPPGGFKNSNSCALQGGYMDYRKATAFSSNTWYVTLEKRIGVNAVKKFSKSVGLSAPDTVGPRSLSYTLGTVGNPPIDVSAALSTFSNKGIYCPPTPIEEAKYRNGKAPAIPDKYNPQMDSCRAVMSPHNAGIVLKAMRANVSGEIPHAFGLKARINGYDTVGKSGTNEHTNTAWTQLAAQYTVFTNVYDMDMPTRGVDGVYYRGSYHSWHDNTAMKAANKILKGLLAEHKNVPLDYNNTDRKFKKTFVNESAFFTIPSVIGLKPEQAVNVLRNAGIYTNVSKKKRPTPDGFTDGVIVEQSIKPGEKISKSTKKEMILYIGQK